ncbi:acyltransferase domain-containing protein [Streptomyces sp. NBC_01754]|uniref:type I polyketide synthase n=1 Tax=Streptomyces sp. NBC_01754 TaxID=2975930 RepID=UPI002DD7F2E1|nr:beta-ketoacyl synthase N-terminal-like domain-containing protein [Streptomyces sp. NBC_01754]WSC95536.1 acyltransferase domain-containing protein [Streptomyces sp. NBC_01754]
MGPIAIVGIDCRFPGAPDTGAYWDLLMRSRDGVGQVPGQRWNAEEFHSPDGSEGHSNTTEGGFITDPDAFDNEFFTVSPREAAAMDPQQRLLMQCAWRAVEDAGLAPRELAGSSTGVFVGVMGNEWAQLHLTDYARVTAQAGSGNGYCMAANRISYHLDLKGPSLAVDTACSSSLVAVHLAANALLAGECDYAIAGGVNIALTPALAIFYTQAGLSAPDGRCKPFSAEADGIGRGEGVGTVVLRRLEDAVADGQQVYAVIRGTAVNQDGRSNGITAPNRWSQQDVLAAAYRRAGVEPTDVTFTEGHGTGTVLGDMMEVKALGHHHKGRDVPMALGSVKGNLGHTEGAAGIAGLIKVALSLHHRTVPASRFAVKENQQLKLKQHGLRLLKAPLRLRSGTVVAGLSSFGMGGTNAHAVLESAPPPAAGRDTTPHTEDPVPSGIGASVFTLTAPSADALRRNLLAQADAVTARRVPLDALSWSSNRIKAGHRHRFAATASGTEELAGLLRDAAGDEERLASLTGTPAGKPRTAFLFTGQGSQYEGMTAGLHQASPLYRHFLDEADAALLPHTGGSVRDLVLAGDQGVHRTAWTQPALFAVGYALGRTLGELGVRPDLLLGHSLGEYAAACLADVFPLEAAARLIAARGALMQRLPEGGGMLTVFAGRDQLLPHVADEPLVSVAVVNGPQACVLSGDLAALTRIEKGLDAERLRTKWLTVSHAFHSPLMEPMLERFADVAREVGGGIPRLPVYSTVRGRLLENEPMDADYWVDHVRDPVLFAAAAGELLDEGPTHLVEIGPQPVLATMSRRLGTRGTGPGPALVLPVRGRESGGGDLAEALAALHRGGLDPRWDAVYPARARTPQRLAPYVFSTEHRYWTRTPIEAGVAGGDRAEARPPAEDATTATAEPAAERVLTVHRFGGDDDHVARSVREAVGQVGGYAPAELPAHLRLYEDLGFDSVMVMELKNRIEEKLPATGPLTVQDLLPRLTSVGALIGFLREHVSSTSFTGSSTAEERTA